MISSFRFSAILCFIFSFLPVPAFAYDFRPLVIQLTPAGAGSSQSAVVTNSHKEPIAIEMSVRKRAQAEDGSDILSDEPGDFIISPMQMVIAPGKSQSVRIQWIGESNPKVELAYRLIVNQLPIRFRREKQGERTFDVSMKYRYEAALYVMPQGAAPAIRVVSAAPGTDAQGKPVLKLRLASEGTRRAILDQPALTLSPQGGGAPVKLEGDAVKPLINLNVLPGFQRTVDIPWPETLPPGPVQAALQTQFTVLN
jgi:fimbrial chaperone protein